RDDGVGVLVTYSHLLCDFLCAGAGSEERRVPLSSVSASHLSRTLRRWGGIACPNRASRRTTGTRVRRACRGEWPALKCSVIALKSEKFCRFYHSLESALPFARVPFR